MSDDRREVKAEEGPVEEPAVDPEAEPKRRPEEEDAVQEAVDAGALRELPPVTSAVVRSTNAVNALIHLYRGEMGRMTAYRARMDTSANWAITTSALATTFTLGTAERSHAVFLFLMGLLYFFLHLESRRFSSYESSRQRVRLMERSFFPHVLGRTQDERWLEDLLDHLQHPAFPTVQLFSAMSWRLRRIYMWLYAGVLLAWLSKLETIELPGLSELTGTGGAAGAAAAGARAAGGLAAASVWEVIERAGVGSVPGWLVCAGVAALYAWLVFLTLKPGREHPLANPYRNERLRSGAGRRGTAPAESRADGRRGARAESGAGASAEARGRGRAAA